MHSLPCTFPVGCYVCVCVFCNIQWKERKMLTSVWNSKAEKSGQLKEMIKYWLEICFIWLKWLNIWVVLGNTIFSWYENFLNWRTRCSGFKTQFPSLNSSNACRKDITTQQIKLPTKDWKTAIRFAARPKFFLLIITSTRALSLHSPMLPELSILCK